jgi:predicted phage tail protein
LIADCSVRVVGRVEYWVQKDIITIIPVFHDYQDIMTFNTITGLQTYRSSFHFQIGWGGGMAVSVFKSQLFPNTF